MIADMLEIPEDRQIMTLKELLIQEVDNECGLYGIVSPANTKGGRVGLD